jgi:predicted alpha/beta-hydrolase family hydrolase
VVRIGQVRPYDAPSGPGRLHVDGDGPARLVLGHGAGGGVDAPDLLAARDAAVGLGLQCVRVEQPWRVRGRRVA